MDETGQQGLDLGAHVRSCAPRIVDTVAPILTEGNSTLGEGDARAHAAEMVDVLIAALLADPLDVEAVAALGAHLERLGNLQPDTLVKLQMELVVAMIDCLRSTGWERGQFKVARLLFELGSGFFIGKAQRASSFEVDTLSKMGHDLKTPINTVTGFARVMLKGIDGPLTDFQREDLVSIYEAGQALYAFVDDLFTVRKRDARRTHLYNVPFEVIDLVSDVVRIVQPLANMRGHCFEARLKGDLGVMIQDASTIRWVLLALLSYLTRLAANGCIILVAVRDSVVSQEVTFEAVYRPLAGSDTSAPLNLGKLDDWTRDVGLATAQRFCHEMGGSLSWEADEGLKFTVRFPSGGEVDS